jgi:superoxide dismutase, Fe-Mn family
MNRRAALTSLVAGTAAATVTRSVADAKRPPPPPAITPVAPGTHAVVPLAFRPSRLRGLSEKLVTSHHANNYGGAVKNLNAVELALAKVNRTTPGYEVAGLRERELTYANSVYLHESYFAILGGNGKRAGDFANALATQFGSEARWEELVRATALSLGGGSGWVVIALSPLTRDLRIVGSGGHAPALAAGIPIFVLDMFEHAYALDYGAAHARYIDAFFANLDWAALDRRFRAARG